MSSGSDEDVTEASIYDLDHAPSVSTAWNGRGNNMHREPSSPQRQLNRSSHSRRSITSLGDTLPTSSSFYIPPDPMRTRSYSLITRSLSFRGTSDGATTSSLGPPRRRALSQPVAISSNSVGSSSPDVKNARSFPPDSMEFNNRRVSFMGPQKSPGAHDLPGMEEVKEDEEGVSAEEGLGDKSGSGGDPVVSPLSERNCSDAQLYGESCLTEEDGDEMSSVATSSPKPVVFCGITLPLWFSKRRISWNRVATFVVDKAPCFLCIRMAQGTYRSVLVRLNILCAFFATLQLASALWFYIIIQNPRIADRKALEGKMDDQTSLEVVTNVWNLNGPVWCLGACALVVLVALALTVRAVRNVYLAGTIRFLWVILWVIPLQLFWTVGLFDYFQVTQVWIKFWWRDRTMAWFRNRFCPPDTARTLCTVPVFVNDTVGTAWCEKHFSQSSCVDIRNEAQAEMEKYVITFYYLYAVCTIVFMLLLFLVVKTLESIISRPLVQKSRESNIPAWLLLPIVGCMVCGTLYSFSSTSVLSTRSEARWETTWIGPLFIAAGGMFITAALLALFLGNFQILNTRDKRTKSIAISVFIVLSISIVLVLATVFAVCVRFCVSFQKIPIDDSDRGDIACFIDRSGSCTGCHNTLCPEWRANDAAVIDCNSTSEKRCPEWSKDDVTKIIQSQAKAGATLAGIFLMYGIGCLRFGFTLRTHISNYMIAYV